MKKIVWDRPVVRRGGGRYQYPCDEIPAGTSKEVYYPAVRDKERQIAICAGHMVDLYSWPGMRFICLGLFINSHKQLNILTLECKFPFLDF